MSKSLSLKYMPDDPLDMSEVEAPEFGVDEDGENFVVKIRALTVGEFNSVIRRAYVVEAEEQASDGDRPYKLGFSEETDEQCLVAAWCSVDDEGNLVFGVTKREAELRVRTLHRKYQPLILRIYQEAWKISKLGLEAPASDEAITEEALKN